MTSCSPGAYFGFGKGGRHGERGGAEPITEVLERSPHQGLKAEPLVRGSGGEACWSWSTFSFWAFNGSGKFAHFSPIS